MEISNTEIARVALCSEGAVRKAVASGKIVEGDCSTVVSFCLERRLKALGMGFMDDMVGERLPAGVQRGCDGLGQKHGVDSYKPFPGEVHQTADPVNTDIGYVPMSEEEFGA